MVHLCCSGAGRLRRSKWHSPEDKVMATGQKKEGRDTTSREGYWVVSGSAFRISSCYFSLVPTGFLPSPLSSKSCCPSQVHRVQSSARLIKLSKLGDTIPAALHNQQASSSELFFCPTPLHQTLSSTASLTSKHLHFYY